MALEALSALAGLVGIDASPQPAPSSALAGVDGIDPPSQPAPKSPPSDVRRTAPGIAGPSTAFEALTALAGMVDIDASPQPPAPTSSALAGVDGIDAPSTQPALTAPSTNLKAVPTTSPSDVCTVPGIAGPSMGQALAALAGLVGYTLSPQRGPDAAGLCEAAAREAAAREATAFGGRAVAAALVFGFGLGSGWTRWVEPRLLAAAGEARAAARRRCVEARLRCGSWCRAALAFGAAQEEDAVFPGTKLRRAARPLDVSIVDVGGRSIDAGEVRSMLDDGDLAFFRFDGAAYVHEATPTDAPAAADDDLLRSRSYGRVLDGFSGAVRDAGLSLASTEAAFNAVADAFVSETQLERYAAALRALRLEKRPGVALLRLVKRPGEYAEPARPGDVFVVWAPVAARRSIRNLSATTAPVVNALFESLSVSRVLSPFTVRVEAGDADSIVLDYGAVYRKLFQADLA
ncbi:hypothetical protein M885DRAFT_545438 [Pelagophyceae sp. CCMP2097]|nr:hypothetical protein M885DRAFT_545438 [Pelagophyceae sp. CCMP2097]